MDIEKIREVCTLRKIKWSVHVAARMAERDIKRSDVINCIMNGEIIEHYINDYPYPSCLIFGYTLRNRVIHVVLGYDDFNQYQTLDAYLGALVGRVANRIGKRNI